MALPRSLLITYLTCSSVCYCQSFDFSRSQHAAGRSDGTQSSVRGSSTASRGTGQVHRQLPSQRARQPRPRRQVGRTPHSRKSVPHRRDLNARQRTWPIAASITSRCFNRIPSTPPALTTHFLPSDVHKLLLLTAIFLSRLTTFYGRCFQKRPPLLL